MQYVDLFTPLSDSQNQLDAQYTLDGIHLNGSAYLVWRQVIEKYVVEWDQEVVPPFSLTIIQPVHDESWQ